MSRLLQFGFFALVVRPLVLVGLGLNVRHRERLPVAGPAVLAANHNSHLDTLVLMTLLGMRLLPRIRPVAAADYFLRNRLVAWFSQTILGIIPIERKGRAPASDPLAAVDAALRQGDIVLLFPEGTRGEPEQLAEFKSGVAHLARKNPAVPVIPLFMHGLGKTLPRGKWIPVPFFCDVFVGEPLFGREDHRGFMAEYAAAMSRLAGQGQFAAWD